MSLCVFVSVSIVSALKNKMISGFTPPL